MPPLRCACLVARQGARLLLVRVRQNQHWYLPGGKIEPHESAQSALQRELAEELGIAGVELRPLFVLPFVQPPVRCHNFVYETNWDGPVHHQPEEIVSGGWLDLAELTAQLRDPDTDFVPDGRAVALEWLRRAADPSS